MFYLKDKKASETLIFLRSYVNGSQIKYGTGMSIDPKNWDDKRYRPISKRGSSKFKHIEIELNRLENEFNKIIHDAKMNNHKISTKEVRVLLNKFKLGNNIVKKKTVKIQVIDGYQIMIDEKTRSKTITPETIKKYKHVKGCLEKFEKHRKKKLKWEDIDDTFYNDYLEFSYNVMNHSDNTVGRYIGFVKTLMQWALKKELHSNEKFQDFKKFKREADNVALTYDELVQLFEYEFDNDYLNRAKDLFCIGCFSGQRFSDYSVFEIADYKGGMIIKRAEKTESFSYIPVDANPRLKFLLEKYEWKVPSITNQKFNEYIKEACKIVGINDLVKKTVYRGTSKDVDIYEKWELISSHTARRTFITLALQRGMTYKAVMKITGIKKIETLMIYDKVDDKELINQVSRVYG